MGKCKQYAQKFRTKWLEDPAFKEWLIEVPSDNSQAYCVYCHCNLKARLHSLVKHVNTKKHIVAITKGIRTPAFGISTKVNKTEGCQSQSVQDEVSQKVNNTSLYLSENEEEYIFLGKWVALQLKEMDQRQRLIAEKLVSDVVFNGRLGNLTEHSSINLAPPFSVHILNGQQSVSS